MFLALAAGMLCAYLGIFSFPALLAVGAALFLLGYLGALRQLGRVYRLSPHPDKRHEAYVWSWLGGGAVGLALFIAGMYWGRQTWIAAAFSAALWLCLVPLTVTVCYRLIPFFSSRALPGYRMFQAAWVLPLVTAFSIGHFLLRWGLGTSWCLISDLPFLGLALYLSIRWGLLRSFRNQLLAMLHVGFAWLPVALALYVARGLLSALGGAAGGGPCRLVDLLGHRRRGRAAGMLCLALAGHLACRPVAGDEHPVVTGRNPMDLALRRSVPAAPRRRKARMMHPAVTP
ncbi:MAG: hypothetical protein B7X10_06780 [Burkholderiales bacterium 21-58-4]|nr:MAG: hypothetical protein B7X10_06780 [Burkholderiales bacterium 21-58-4]